MKHPKIKILIFGIVTVSVLLPVIIPQFTRARATAHLNTCINYLRQIDGAKQVWAKENNKSSNDIPTWNDLRPYLGNGRDLKYLVCPDGGTYTIGRVADAPKCSIPGHELN